MPVKVTLDGLEINFSVIGGDVAYTIIPVFTDPDTLGNGYLFILIVNNKIKQSLHTTDYLIKEVLCFIAMMIKMMWQ